MLIIFQELESCSTCSRADISYGKYQMLSNYILKPKGKVTFKSKASLCFSKLHVNNPFQMHNTSSEQFFTDATVTLCGTDILTKHMFTFA